MTNPRFRCLVVVAESEELIGFAATVSKVSPKSALLYVFTCSLLLGLGANAIVAAGHALVADVAASWRNAALNLLDICFGLGLASLPLFVQSLQRRAGLSSIFLMLSGLSIVLLLLVAFSRFSDSRHSDSSPVGAAGSLFRNPSFVLLASALFMYVGAEVSVGKWVVTFMERDAAHTQKLWIDHGSCGVFCKHVARDA